MANNYDDVIAQLEAEGLMVDHLVVGRLVRCKVEGDREKRGWYAVHELTLDGGDVVLVGSFGVWRGDDNGARKIEIKGTPLSAEQRAAMRKRLAEDRRKAEASRRRQAERAAEAATRAWRKCSEDGDSDYLTRKGVQAHGVRFSPGGAVVVPMLDISGRIHGLQFILSRKRHGDRINRTGRDKEFWPPGLAKRGHFHLIGSPTWVCLLTEGYATGATLHEATGLPVAVAFDAGNLQPVAEALHKRYPGCRIVICADDDAFGRCKHCDAPVRTGKPEDPCPACGEPHGRENAGRSRASSAALAVGGHWIAPRFDDDEARWAKFTSQGHKLTDFNDLHALEGLHTVRTQVEASLDAFGVQPPKTAPRPSTTGGAGKVIVPFATTDELLERFALIYGGAQTVFDHREHMLLSLSDMRDACITRETHRRWMESPEKQIVRLNEVGFDPAETDHTIQCNLWGGWPTEPRKGTCETLLDLLRFLCSYEENPRELFDWVLKWLAYPLQNPGAKMKTSLVFHGPQGAGKNMFFEAYMSIFDEYGRVIDQSAVEDKFNDWASRKLFLIADEVVTRQELYHIKGKVKALITGDWIRINPKNVTAHDERNHVNIVFLSNEVQPLMLEEGDRRFVVIWTPPKLSPHFYVDVQREIAAGGVAALHHFLLNLDLGDFANHTNPPMTRSKADLIDLGLDSTERFWKHYTAGQIDGIEPLPAKSEDIFDLYRTWCQRNGIGKPAPAHILLARLGKRPDARKSVCRYMKGTVVKQATFVFPPDKLEPPEGESLTAWVTEQSDAFRNAVADYKGQNYAQM
ncbi:DUF5906 domain-containing protein [Pseudazoarcus pumilus]|uniref:DNA primase n=1 Tax=Pseudazoarcus pumilus TaxID=2067960 RepID=A0A2I6S818_9RHOO|nr:DUF5906 domain-containing protein [Pseudazoarcus pumilus]AUN95419.1 DNA primase [Pseudazoarcus pumilus]